MPTWCLNDATATATRSRGSAVRPALAAFRTLRAEILEALEPLSRDAWERTATVSAPPGKVYENSILYYGDWMARHERSHLKHIARILKETAA